MFVVWGCLNENNEIKNTSPVALLGDYFFQAVQMHIVQIRINSLVVGKQRIIDDSLSILANTKRNLLGRQF